MLLKGCIKGDRDSQRLLYQQFYPYALSICLRYSNNTEDAREILNDGFMKVFKHIKQFRGDELKPWMRRIMINTAIDHYRKNIKQPYSVPIEQLEIQTQVKAEALGALSHEELMRLVQALPVSYRTVFNLHAIDGYSHVEISKKLNIEVGTSKSHLAKARNKLKAMINRQNQTTYAQSV